MCDIYTCRSERAAEGDVRSARGGPVKAMVKLIASHVIPRARRGDTEHLCSSAALQDGVVRPVESTHAQLNEGVLYILSWIWFSRDRDR